MIDQTMENANPEDMNIISVNANNCNKCKYVNVYVEPKEENKSIKYLYFTSNVNDKGFKERELLSTKINNQDKIYMCIQEEQFRLSQNKFLLGVQCIEKNCKFHVNTTIGESCELPYTNVYSYYASKHNTRQKFKFKDLKSQFSTNHNLNLWIKYNTGREPHFQFTTPESLEQIKCSKYTGFIICNYKIKDETKKEIEIEIISDPTEGTLISLGSNFFDDKNNSLLPLYINMDPLYGLIIHEEGKKNKICYPLNKELNNQFKPFVEVYLYNTKGQISFEDENGEDLGNYIEIKEYGMTTSIDFNNGKEASKLCVGYIEYGDGLSNIDIVFHVRLTDNFNKKAINSNNNHYTIGQIDINAPMISGLIYLKTSKQKSIDIFYSDTLDFHDKNELNFYMRNLLGNAKFYFAKCETYPKCQYEEKDLEKLIHPHIINNNTEHDFTYDSKAFPITPINSNKYLIVIKCEEVQGSEIKKDCAFETSTFSNKNKLHLLPEVLFTRTLVKNWTNNFRISLRGYEKVYRIFIDLMIYTGDANLFFVDNLDFDYHEYEAANKVYYVVDVKSKIDHIDFYVAPNPDRAFYSIKYFLKTEDVTDIMENTIESGNNYLLTFTNDKYKFISFMNYDADFKIPYLISFYSLNCDYKIEEITSVDQEGKETVADVEFLNNYGQKVKTEKDPNYMDYVYRFKISVKNYNDKIDKICKLYTSSQGILDEDKENLRHIIVSDRTTQRIKFSSNFKHIKYLYPHLGLENEVIIDLKLVDQFEYKITIYFENHKSETYTGSKSQKIYLLPQEWENICKDKNQPCVIIIDVTMDKVVKEQEPILETTIYSIDNYPQYLQKNYEYKLFNYKTNFDYYYTELSKGDSGYVLLNYLFGSGNIYASIVKIGGGDLLNDDHYKWRGLYSFPNKIQDSPIGFVGYLKKLYILEENTKNCGIGNCYLLISIKSNILSDYYQSQPFLLEIGIKNKEVSNQNIINIPINEYIVGDIDNFSTEKDKISYNYYKINLLRDADEIVIDWQSDSAILIINVNGNLPTKDNHQIEFPNMKKDSLYHLSKSEIQKHAQISTLKNLVLIIGVYTEKLDSLYKTIYSFKFHLHNTNSLDVYHIRSDQKVLCDTKEYSGEYICLFALIMDPLLMQNHIMIYVKTDEKVKIYADIINDTYIEENNQDYLKNHIPNENSRYKNQDENNYIYIEDENQMNKHLFIKVKTQKAKTIQLLNSFFNIMNKITPNPSTYQLFTSKEKELVFSFNTNDDLIVNFYNIKGNADLYWEDNNKTLYYLNGRDCRISLTTNGKDFKNSKLYLRNYENEVKDTKDPGLAFYISYYFRLQNYNLDQSIIGRSTQINYRKGDFPVNFFAHLDSLEKDIFISIKFFDLFKSDGKNLLTSYFSKDIFDVRMTIIDEKSFLENIYEKEKRPTYISKKIENGIFDASSEVMQFSLTSEQLKSFGISEKDSPIIFYSIDNKKNDQLKFDSLSLENQIYKLNEIIEATEKIYYYGKVAKNEVIYKLNTNAQKTVMGIEFSANSGNLDWAVTTNENEKKNSTFSNFESKWINGRSILTFSISKNDKNVYLIVFEREKKDDNKKLNNFAFKYYNGKDKSTFKTFQLKNENFDIYKTDIKDEYEVYFYSANSAGQTHKTFYSMKIVKKKDHLALESYNTLAVTESEENLYFNYEDKGEFISFKFKETNLQDLAYIQIIAHVKDNNINEYLSYNAYTKFTPKEQSEKPKPTPTPPSSGSESRSGSDSSGGNLGMILGIVGGGIGLIIIVVVIIVCIKRKKSNQDKLNDVNKVSFQGEGLVQNENENETLT